MLRIQCPWCGERDQTEFRCGGQSHIIRPVNPALTSDQEWANYLFYRDNPKGIHHERWVHTWGCRQWFNLARNTVTHEILSVSPIAAETELKPTDSNPPAHLPGSVELTPG